MSIIQGTAKATAGDTDFYDFPIDQSLRFDGNSYLSRTFTNGNHTSSFTFSVWVKKSSLEETLALLGAYYTQSSAYRVTFFGFSGTDDTVDYWQHNNDSGFNFNISSTALTRDISGWYHILLSHNRTNHTSSLYVNGDSTGYWLDTSTTSGSQAINGTFNHYLGSYVGNPGSVYGHYKGYMAEINFIDGTALTPTSFGETKNGVWIPKNPSGLTYGTNGFRLTFENGIETIGGVANQIRDESSNSNHWTKN